MEVDSYLKRIKSENLKEVSLENLKQLHSNHILNIPFENFGIALNEHVKMDLAAMYDKIIKKNRGGFCFELNYLFSWLLKSLGYDLILISCRVFKEKKYSHLAMLVNINGQKYLADVGFGPGFRSVLEFVSNKIQQDKTGCYSIKDGISDEIEIQAEDCYTLYRTVKNLNENDWKPVYFFNVKPHKIEDFQEVLDYVQSPVCTHFYNRSFCFSQTENSIKTLLVYKFTDSFYENGIEVKTDEYQVEKDKYNEILKSKFGIVLDRDFQPRYISL